MTDLRYGEKYDMRLVANLLMRPIVNFFLNWPTFLKVMNERRVASFYGPHCSLGLHNICFLNPTSFSWQQVLGRKYKYKYLRYKYKYLRYKYKYFSDKYKYKYQYLKLVLTT